MNFEVMNKIVYLAIFLVSCNYQGNSKFKNNKALIDTTQKTLYDINYKSPSINYDNSQVIIQADTNFPDDRGGNVMLLNYLQSGLFNSKLDSINVCINYGRSKYISFFSKEGYKDMGKRYYAFAKQALTHIKMDDCVYYDLTVEMVKPQTHYVFEGDLWTLISKLSENDQEAKRSFIAFYNWSSNPYDENLKVVQKKYDWFVKEIGIDPKSIDISFIDSLYQQKGYKGFFR